MSGTRIELDISASPGGPKVWHFCEGRPGPLEGPSEPHYTKLDEETRDQIAQLSSIVP